MAILQLTLVGTPHEIGWQQARQIAGCAALVRQIIAARLADLARLGVDPTGAELQAVADALQAYDPALLAQLRGLAEGMGIDYSDLLCYTLSSYLRDRWRTAAASVVAAAEGCTVWAAAPPSTQSSLVLLAKNRDYHRDHSGLQTLARVTPAAGYGYLCLGSAGSPTVFSSGINERGLAVADTHVLSTDLGPGMARFSLMREILERHATTAEALDYLRSVQHMGGGTLVLADVSGQLAICESGHHYSGFVVTHGGHLVSTNHFATAAMADCWIESEPPLLRGNSVGRRQRALQSLDSSAGRVDQAWAQTLMAAHGAPQNALCRHPLSTTSAPRDFGQDTSTISSVILLPRGLDGDAAQSPALLLAAGSPCKVDWSTWVS